jgi:hypothetical protein
VRKTSLAETLDRVNDVYFRGGTPSEADRVEAAVWIAERSGLRGSYELMPAPTKADFEKGFKVFTGERFKSGAGGSCKLGCEAMRALILLNDGLDVRQKAVVDALERSRKAMSKRIHSWKHPGRYCCGSCAVATWRNALADGLDNPAKIIAAGVRELKSARDDKGGWRTFPHWYTLLALSEIDSRAATAEKRYAAPRLERFLAAKPRRDKYNRRRRAVAERILAEV